VATTADEVRRDIERARSDLGTTLEAIGDKVAPRKVAARAKDNVHERIEDVKDRVSPGRITRRPIEAVRRGVHSVMGSAGSAAGTVSGATARPAAGRGRRRVRSGARWAR